MLMLMVACVRIFSEKQQRTMLRYDRLYKNSIQGGAEQDHKKYFRRDLEKTFQ